MSSRFQIQSTPLDGLLTIKRMPIEDDRGQFERTFCSTEMAKMGIADPIRQINRTTTTSEGTVRGLHLQLPPQAETKIVTCLKGEVFDVALDLRANSPTFGEWHAVILSRSNLTSLVIPQGFAHGFQTLRDDCDLLYFHTAEHDSELEFGVNVLDQNLAISWPLRVKNLSERDKGLKSLSSDFSGVQV